MGHEDDGGVEGGQSVLEPLEGGDVEVVRGLVEQQEIRVAGEGARQRAASELAAAECAEGAVEVGVLEAEAAHRGHRLLAPVVAAGVLEPRLRAGVPVEGGVVALALRHLGLELLELAFEGEQVAAALEDVLAQAEVQLSRRPLIMQRDARGLGEHELAEVHGGLAREHAEQRGLAAAVAAGQRKPVPLLELERDAAEQRLTGDVLPEIGCDDDCHGR